MMSATIACSIDYSLFLLSRYREEAKKGYPVREVVKIVISTAGHTVLVSGLTLAGCFLVLCVFPVNMLRTPGLGAGLAILCALATNLSLTPAMLLAFPNFFGASLRKSWLPWSKDEAASEPLIPQSNGKVRSTGVMAVR